jgi:hypothetical protein
MQNKTTIHPTAVTQRHVVNGSIQNKLRGLSPQANYTDRATGGMSPKLVPTFADKGCRVVSVTDPHGRILGFLDRSRYYFFQVAPQLYSRG